MRFLLLLFSFSLSFSLGIGKKATNDYIMRLWQVPPRYNDIWTDNTLEGIGNNPVDDDRSLENTSPVRKYFSTEKKDTSLSANDVLDLAQVSVSVLQEVTNEGNVDSEVKELFEEISGLLQRANHLLYETELKDGRLRQSLVVDSHPVYERIRKIVENVMQRRGIPRISPAQPPKSPSSCICPPSSTDGPSSSSSSSQTTQSKRIAQPLLEGPWSDNDRNNAVDLSSSPELHVTTGNHLVETVTQITGSSSSSPLSMTETNKAETTTNTVTTTSTTTSPSRPTSSVTRRPSFEPLAGFVFMLREYANLVHSVNTRLANIASSASEILQTSSKLITGQLRGGNDTVWVYGQPFTRAVEAYSEVLKTLSEHFATVNRQIGELRVHVFGINRGKREANVETTNIQEEMNLLKDGEDEMKGRERERPRTRKEPTRKKRPQVTTPSIEDFFESLNEAEGDEPPVEDDAIPTTSVKRRKTQQESTRCDCSQCMSQRGIVQIPSTSTELPIQQDVSVPITTTENSNQSEPEGNIQAIIGGIQNRVNNLLQTIKSIAPRG